MVHKTAREAVQCIKSGQRVFVHGAAATPQVLLSGLTERHEELSEVELIHLHTMGDAVYAEPRYQLSFRTVNLFVGENMRKKMDFNHVDYLPCFFSEIPALFRSGRRPLDVALIHVSPPDAHGYCTLGVSIDVARAAVDTARIIIAQINPQMPRVHGDGFIHVSRIDHAIEVNEALPQVPHMHPSPILGDIGEAVATLIEDGATLQLGIGAIPDAVCEALTHHRHLGLHSETWSDGALALIQSGVIDNSRKHVHPGKSIAAFVHGSRALYDYVHDNPAVHLLDVAYVNDPAVIARNPKVVAINSAVEIDLTGQVCADSIGHRIISGVGGQMDFLRGAALSEGGKPIIAISSFAKNGESRIVPTLHPGAGVVTTRAHVHFVVTEFGIVDLAGKTLSERAKSLIGISHPSHREQLSRDWHQICRKGAA